MVPRTIPRAEHPISRGYIDPDALRILYRLQRSGYKGYLVGGSVRDLMTGRTPKDFDIGTDAKPGELRRLFRNSRVIGRRFKLVHIFFDGGKAVEVSTFRRRPDPEAPGAEEGGRHGPDLLIREDNTFGSPEEDALRRDFTINGLFYDIATFSVLDFVGGVNDLERRVVRTIGDPRVRFLEDPVRMLRACEFAARLSFDFDPETAEAIDEHRKEIRRSAAPRVTEELLDPLRRGWGAPTYRLWSRMGLLDVLVPELDALVGHAAPTASPLRPLFWKLLEECDRRRAAGEGLPEAALLGTLFLPIVLAAVREKGGSGRFDPGRILSVVEEAVNPVAARLLLPNHAVHHVKQGLYTMGRLAETRPGDPVARRLVPKAWFPIALDLLSLYSSASGRYGEALAAWEEVVARAGRRPKAGEDLSDAAPFPEALVPPPHLISRGELPGPPREGSQQGPPPKDGPRRPGRPRRRRRPAGTAGSVRA
jgi:poly(A) polymerase